MWIPFVLFLAALSCQRVATDDEVELGEGISTSQIMWIDWTPGNLPERAVVSGVEANVNTFVCRCFAQEINSWVAGKLNVPNGLCYAELEGRITCTSGQVMSFVDCQGLNCPNDIPAKCEHTCPNV